MQDYVDTRHKKRKKKNCMAISDFIINRKCILCNNYNTNEKCDLKHNFACCIPINKILESKNLHNVIYYHNLLQSSKSNDKSNTLCSLPFNNKIQSSFNVNTKQILLNSDMVQSLVPAKQTITVIKPQSNGNIGYIIVGKGKICICYPETYINEMISFVRRMFIKFQYLLHGNHKPASKSSFILSIDLSKVRNYFLVSNKQNSMEFELNTNSSITTDNQLQINHYENPFLNQGKDSLNIKDPPCIKVSIILKRLISIFSTCNNMLLALESKNVPSLCFRNWHFRSITQGYLLKILLKSINMNILYLMQNIYFVIIINKCSDLNIEFNFELQSEIFTVYDIKPLTAFCIESINWSKRHQHIIENITNIIQNEKNDSLLDVKYDTSEMSIISRQFGVSLHALSNDDNLQTIFHMDLDSSSAFCTDLTVVSDSTFKNDSTHCQHKDRDAQAANIYDFSSLREWTQRISSIIEKHNEDFPLPNMRKYFNETMFQEFSIYDYLHNFTDHWCNHLIHFCTSRDSIGPNFIYSFF